MNRQDQIHPFLFCKNGVLVLFATHQLIEVNIYAMIKDNGKGKNFICKTIDP